MSAKDKCAWCGEPTILATAIGPRQKLGVCPPCFKNYKPCTEAQRARVEAVVRSAYCAATGTTIERGDEIAAKITSRMVDAGDYRASDEALRRYACCAVAAELGRAT